MILHTVNKAPQHNTLSSCLRVASEDCAILLIEDGVYAAISGAAGVPQALFQHKVYALAADVNARGLSNKLAEEVELVDYHTFVALTAQYDCVQSWY